MTEISWQQYWVGAAGVGGICAVRCRQDSPGRRWTNSKPTALHAEVAVADVMVERW